MSEKNNSVTPFPSRPLNSTLATQHFRSETTTNLQDYDLFKLAMEHSAIGMALLLPNGKWFKANKAICDILGYTESELLNIDFQTVTHPDDLAMDLDYVNRLLAGEIQTYSMEKRYYRKDKKIIWVLLTVSLVRDDNNKPLYFISQIQDITEEKDAKEALVNANDELQRLSYQISHDFRSPLRSSISMLQLAEKFAEDGNIEKSNKFRNISLRSLQKLYSLADDILSLTQTKLSKECNQTLLVDHLIDDSLSLLSHLDGMESITVIKDLNFSRPISTKKTRLALIINNLISNAIKYRDMSKAEPTIKISTYDADGHLVLFIQDNGLGIEEAYRDRLFEMFERFHTKAAEGTGLGLYMVKQSADVIGGDIHYQPLPDGSRFTLIL
ncbi:PAS domain S-box-containing protein [Litorimonas taeanensis]|uniref:histidine kinase n=1 Tax=Litorimonas taeanensis TaxID=568099 RepID=A0A420WFJ5_9PROT|nr:HAMP domain-containing sensor histidine kinase [Litorimonas taeanensis]RKQ69774.1 PAS domain S-box-containing protein [Litorimonas taeanensis]